MGPTKARVPGPPILFDTKRIPTLGSTISGTFFPPALVDESQSHSARRTPTTETAATEATAGVGQDRGHAPLHVPSIQDDDRRLGKTIPLQALESLSTSTPTRCTIP